ncbi:MAG: Eco57I restriction-modification methylase domain-containing protein [Muribaculaceae bacterium]|nr:Eco57I restriction-modification methylase domain-containing protein [Muribaculaceae bacterium]
MRDIELKRQQLQQELDSQKSLTERNKLGQYSTPYPLACQICDHLKQYLGDTVDSFLEPAIGTGVFYSALSECVNINRSVGYEIDEHYYILTSLLWKSDNIDIINQDFLKTTPQPDFSLIIANPPYSRHHHLSKEMKMELSLKIKDLYDIKVSGLSGLYLYFIILSTQWLIDGGLSCWLIPAEFLSVNYGSALRKFLLDKVDLISIHCFKTEDVQFNDALVSSAVIIFRNSQPTKNPVMFSWGNDMNQPAVKKAIEKDDLSSLSKWTEVVVCRESYEKSSQPTIGTFFNIKRGIATGDNNFFVVDKDTVDKYGISKKVLTLVVPPPRKLNSDVFDQALANENNLYLITCSEPNEVVRAKYNGFSDYLSYGLSCGVNLKANCKNRSPWYKCEKRDVSPILVSYMGRDNGKLPIRFILNEVGATATNSYLMLYPKEEYRYLFKGTSFSKKVWKILQSIPKEVLMAHGRSYGGGLLKW